MKREDKIP
jgi:hypothetical protein